MAEQSHFQMMMLCLRENCRHYTGYPKDLGPSRVLHFTSEREFVQLLHRGHPVVVAFTIRSNYTKHLDKVLEEAASVFYPDVIFMRVSDEVDTIYCLCTLFNRLSMSALFNFVLKCSPRIIVHCTVECPKYPGFCITRQKKEYPFVEIFHSPEQALNAGKVVDPNVTKYSVKVLPYNYDVSTYGFREFFKRHGVGQSTKSSSS